MIKETSKKFANITHESLNMFKTLCEGCSSKAHYIQRLLFEGASRFDRHAVYGKSTIQMDHVLSGPHDKVLCSATAH